MAEAYSREPGYRENIEIALGGLLGGGREGSRRAKKVTSLLDYIPFAGGALGAGDAKDAFGRGNYLEGGLLSAATALGAVPVAGPALSKIAKTQGRRLLYDAPYSNYKIDPDLPAQIAAGTTIRKTSRYSPEKTISPEDLPRDGYLLNLVGDRSNVGEVTRIGGEKLDVPILLDGGMGYMRGKDTGAWASDERVVKSLSNKVKQADGRPVVGAYMAMSGTGSDFANMTRAVAMRNFDPAALRKKDIKSFNARFNSAKAYEPRLRDDFPGIDSPKLNEWLDKSGTRRAAFFDFMDKAEWRNLGFPNVTEARHVIQDPKLRDIPAGVEQYGGQSLSLLNPSGVMRPTADLKMPHGTYDTDLAGKYIGGLDQGMPRSLLFPDFHNARRASGVAPSGDNRAFQMKQVLQPMDQQWLDGVMSFLNASRRK